MRALSACRTCRQADIPAAREFRQNAVREAQPLDRVVAGFRPAAGEDDLVRLCPDQGRDPPARDFDRVVSGLAECMSTGGVAEVLAEEGQHRVEDGRIDRRGRIVVEVDRRHGVAHE